VAKYDPVFLSAEMTDQGYWRVTFSVAPGLRLPVTLTRIGITRSEAIALAQSIIPDVTPAREETR